MNNRIAFYRKKKKISSRQLALNTGITPSYMCSLENGKRTNPSKEVMENIANALGRTVTEIFFSDDLIKTG